MRLKTGHFSAAARRHWLKAAIFLAVAGLLLGNRGFRLLIAHSIQLRSLHSELGALRQEEGELKAAVAEAKKDDQALERAARKDLGYLLPGEVEYRFPPPKSP